MITDHFCLYFERREAIRNTSRCEETVLNLEGEVLKVHNEHHGKGQVRDSVSSVLTDEY